MEQANYEASLSEIGDEMKRLASLPMADGKEVEKRMREYSQRATELQRNYYRDVRLASEVESKPQHPWRQRRG